MQLNPEERQYDCIGLQKLTRTYTCLEGTSTTNKKDSVSIN